MELLDDDELEELNAPLPEDDEEPDCEPEEDEEDEGLLFLFFSGDYFFSIGLTVGYGTSFNDVLLLTSCTISFLSSTFSMGAVLIGLMALGLAVEGFVSIYAGAETADAFAFSNDYCLAGDTLV
jgi:hypothetical protein